ncbi:hemoglobin [Actinopolyspora xinjiangensis]|uniref:Hemoglobin n=1 Tax=Actinopolyspora xinjiangensis TaxID=405564 RepID=A0A1H0WH18_9ACTN|nr:group 1 truncated hemoglobin [Actinopolyspora xinjiangensis]SDP90020.1 hemoglobin [Actinopolyspora xinjiangensis]
MNTIHEQIGGEPVVRDVVFRFYEKALADSRLAGYFHGANLGRLREHQVRLFTAALGGSQQAPGADEAPTPGIHHDEYDLVIGHLADALRESSIPETLLSGILFAVAPLARDVINVPVVATST